MSEAMQRQWGQMPAWLVFSGVAKASPSERVSTARVSANSWWLWAVGRTVRM